MSTAEQLQQQIIGTISEILEIKYKSKSLAWFVEIIRTRVDQLRVQAEMEGYERGINEIRIDRDNLGNPGTAPGTIEGGK